MKPKADSKKIEILRVDKDETGFKLFDGSLADDNLTLANGDVVNIKSILNNVNNAVLVKGHFQKPGFYPLSESMRIGDLITEDNILSMTDLGYVLVKRSNKSGKNAYKFLQVDLNKIFINEQSEENIFLEERDEITIFPSLIKSNDIVTKIFEDSGDSQNVNGNELESKDFSNSLSALRKSILSTNQPIQNNVQQNTPDNENNELGQSQETYYEYQVYNYCVIPKKVIIDIIELEGFSTDKTYKLDELKGINSVKP